MTRSTRLSRTPRLARLAVAGGLVLALGPMTAVAPSAHAEEGADEAGATAYGGYTSSAFATPLRIEVFEPSLPIPVDAGVAQLEFNLGYSKVKSDSGSSQGKASYLWPGDPVGDGLKTFVEQLGFPPSPLTDGGYPVQANSQFPGDTPTQTDTTVPGGIMRTTSGDKVALSETGFSPDGTLVGPDTSADGGDGDGGGEPSTNMLLDLLNSVGGLLGGLGGGGGAPTASSTASSTAPAAAAPGAPAAGLPGLPAPLAALIDVDGYLSVSKMTAVEGPVVSAARATLGEVRLLGGLVTLGGIDTVAKATTDGTKGEATGTSNWGKLSIAGQQFEIGPDGITAAGQKMPIPGLKDSPAKALSQLGLSIDVPEQTRTVEGDKVTSVSETLRITLDASVLAPLLQLLPTGVLAELIPAQAGPLKGVVAGLSGLASKVVITLGVASSTVETVPPITFDSAGGDAPAGEAPAEAAPEAAAAAAGGGAAGGAAPGLAPAPLGGAPLGGGAPVDAAVAPAASTSGLPALFSIPGMLVLAAFAAAAVAGSWFRRIGVAALGGAGSCPHGLDSGLPDLRKA